MLKGKHAVARFVAVEVIDDLTDGVEGAQLGHGERAGKSLVELGVEADALEGSAAAGKKIFVGVDPHAMEQALPDAADDFGLPFGHYLLR